jgi:copper homeostasis protein
MIEVVCYSIEAVKIAVDCDVDRIELCSAPLEGGLTPSPGLVEQSLKICRHIPVHAMLRCREGNFVYTTLEKELMLNDMQWLSQSGVAGIVCGALLADTNLDDTFLTQIKQQSNNLNLVFHRAIDVCQEPIKAIEWLMKNGFHGVLSSGGSISAEQGMDELKELQLKCDNNFHLLAGGGIRSGNIKKILEKTGVKHIHLSAINSENIADFNLGINSFSLASPYVPNREELKKCMEIFRLFER